MGEKGFRNEVENGHTVVMMGSGLDWVKNYKYLGIIIDNSLSLGKYVKYIY